MVRDFRVQIILLFLFSNIEIRFPTTYEVFNHVMHKQVTYLIRSVKNIVTDVFNISYKPRALIIYVFVNKLKDKSSIF